MSTPRGCKEVLKTKTSEISKTQNKIETIIVNKELENIEATINTAEVPLSENFLKLSFRGNLDRNS